MQNTFKLKYKVDLGHLLTCSGIIKNNERYTYVIKPTNNHDNRSLYRKRI